MYYLSDRGITEITGVSKEIILLNFYAPGSHATLTEALLQNEQLKIAGEPEEDIDKYDKTEDFLFH